METSISYTDQTAFFSSDERKWINRIHKLKQLCPEQVTIIREPEENGGCIYCKVPASWVKIAPKKSINMSEEQKAQLASNLRRFENAQ